MRLLHIALVVADLVVLVVTAALTLRGGDRRPAWVLLLTSGLWLPLNNGVFEGPVLIGLTDDHGLTLTDLFGIGGACLAGWRLRLGGDRPRGRGLLVSAAPVAAVLVVGFLLASFVTDVRVDEQSGPRHRHAHGHHPGLPD